MARTKVLVIDDEQMIRWSIEQTLTAVGYHVEGAEDGARGLAVFRTLRPEVVFLDIRLPDQDGRSVLACIKKEAAQTAVIVMTAFGENCSEDDARRLGAHEYIRKPFNFDDIESLVGRVMQAADGGQSNCELIRSN